MDTRPKSSLGRTGLRLALPIILMFVWPAKAGADPLLLGGETGAMGGAGVASGSDAGMFLLNPAGLARVSSLRVSFSGSLYALSRVNVDKFFNDKRPATTALGVTVLDDLELSSTKIIAVPSVVSVLLGLGPKAGQTGHMVLGGSVVMPENRSYFFEGEANATAAYVGKHSNLYAHESSQIYFGPTFGIQLGQRLFLGASLYAVYQPFRNAINSTYVLADEQGSNYVSIDSRADSQGRSFELLGVAGVQLQATEGLSFGLAISTPSVHLGGSFDGLGETKAFGSAALTTSVRSSRSQGEATRKIPMRITAGLSYRRAKRFGVSADFSALLPTDGARRVETDDAMLTLQPSAAPQRSSTHTVTGWNSQFAFQINVGGELYVRESWVLRAGFFMDRPLHESFADPLTGVDVLELRLAHFGGTLGVSTVQGAVQSTFGVAVSYGSGTTGALTFADIKPRETDVKSLDVIFFITGGFDFSELKRSLGKYLNRGIK